MEPIKWGEYGHEWWARRREAQAARSQTSCVGMCLLCLSSQTQCEDFSFFRALFLIRKGNQEENQSHFVVLQKATPAKMWHIACQCLCIHNMLSTVTLVQLISFGGTAKEGMKYLVFRGKLVVTFGFAFLKVEPRFNSLTVPS